MLALQRDPTTFPVQYLGANVPQAWAAGSCFAMLQMIVGFQPDAPAGKLYIDPALPVSLPELTSKYPRAKPGALGFEPLKAAWGRKPPWLRCS